MEMERNRPRSPSASDEGSGSPRLASSKVCLYATTAIDTDLEQPRVSHDFYVFDLNQKPKEEDDNDNGGFISTKPSLRLKIGDFNYSSSLCVLNSSIYVFFGGPSKAVRSYSLSDGSEGSTLYMNGYKYKTACSVASPDRRKMVVFSESIVMHDRHTDLVDFELFDSTTKEFRALPAFFPESMDFPREVVVKSYGFLDEGGSTFAIEIETDDEHGTMYRLDLKALDRDQVWVKCEAGGGGGSWSSPVFFVIGGTLRFNCSAFAAYDLENDGLAYDVPGPSGGRRPSAVLWGDVRVAAFLDEGKCDGRGGHRLCVLESNHDQAGWDVPAGYERILDHPLVHIAVYELKVASCCGQGRRPEPTSLKPLKFILDSYNYISFFPVFLYPLWD